LSEERKILRTVRLLNPKMCEKCRFNGGIHPKLKIMKCNRGDCDNWVNDEESANIVPPPEEDPFE